jgi:hypothetical protein
MPLGGSSPALLKSMGAVSVTTTASRAAAKAPLKITPQTVVADTQGNNSDTAATHHE